KYCWHGQTPARVQPRATRNDAVGRDWVPEGHFAARARIRSMPSPRGRSAVTGRPADSATSRAPDPVTAAGLAVVLVSALLIFFLLDPRLPLVDEDEHALSGRRFPDQGLATAFHGRNPRSLEG